MSAEHPRYLVVAELGFDHRRDAERTIEDLSHTSFNRCVSTYFKLYKEEPDGVQDGTDTPTERGNSA